MVKNSVLLFRANWTHKAYAGWAVKKSDSLILWSVDKFRVGLAGKFVNMYAQNMNMKKKSFILTVYSIVHFSVFIISVSALKWKTHQGKDHLFVCMTPSVKPTVGVFE